MRARRRARRSPDWLFVWPTGFGAVAPGARDTRWNAKPVRYHPELSGEGLLWLRPGATEPTSYGSGFRLGVQGTISRMAAFIQGHVTHGWVVSPGVSGDTAGAGGLSALGDRAVADGLSDWWAPALVARAAHRHPAIAVSTLEAATWVADQTGTTTLYRLHDDVNIDWGRDDYIANHNLFVCDRTGTELAAVAAPVTFRWLTTGR